MAILIQKQVDFNTFEKLVLMQIQTLAPTYTLATHTHTHTSNPNAVLFLCNGYVKQEVLLTAQTVVLILHVCACMYVCIAHV